MLIHLFFHSLYFHIKKEFPYNSLNELSGNLIQHKKLRSNEVQATKFSVTLSTNNVTEFGGSIDNIENDLRIRWLNEKNKIK